MKSALVTGDMGFIGRHVTEELKNQGWSLTSGIDLKNGVDCRDYFKESDRHFDLVIHCAAVVGGRATIEGNPLHVAIDLSIDAEMFNWALKTRPGRIVYYSTSAAYPVRYQTVSNTFSLIEEFINLDDIQSPDLTYGWAKLSGEMLARYVRQAGVPVTVLRPFSGYGADQDLDYPWPSFIQRAIKREDPFTIWGDGTQVRDWVHVDDVVGATLACVEQEVDGPLNIGTGVATSFLDLAQLCISAADYAPALDLKLEAPRGVHYRVADTDQLIEVYKPKIKLWDAITEAINGT